MWTVAIFAAQEYEKGTVALGPEGYRHIVQPETRVKNEPLSGL